MATEAELLDVSFDFEFPLASGKSYKVSRVVTFEMEQMFKEWVFQGALSEVERSRELARKTGRGMSEAQYQRSMDRITDNLCEGKFKYEGLIVQEALGQYYGWSMMLLLRFQRFDPTVTMSLITKIFSDEEDARRLGQLLNPTPSADSKNEKQGEETQAPAEKN